MSRFQHRGSSASASRSNSTRALPGKSDNSDRSKLEKSSDSSSKDRVDLGSADSLGLSSGLDTTGTFSEETASSTQSTQSNQSTQSPQSPQGPIQQTPPSKPAGSPSPAALNALRTGEVPSQRTASGNWASLKPSISAGINSSAPRRGAMFDPARRGSAFNLDANPSAAAKAAAESPRFQQSTEVQASLPPPKPAEPKPGSGGGSAASTGSTQIATADHQMAVTISVDSEDTSTFGDPDPEPAFVNPFSRSSLKLPNEDAYV